MGVKTVNFHAANASQLFTESLKETGFAVIADHEINQQLIDTVFQAWRDFFASNEKNNYLFNKNDHSGFIPQDLSETAKGHEYKDIKEFFHFYTWGKCPEPLKSQTLELYNALNQLAETLLQWVEDNTPQAIRDSLSMPLSTMIQNSRNTLFRPIHYPAFTGREQAGAIRAAAHEDINLLTLLPAATTKGLQVKLKNGQWFDVPCDRTQIVVNIGDMLDECTDGYFKATTHRVINPSGQQDNTPRLSMPLFLHPRDEVRLSERHTRKSYCEERYKELGLA